jgi:hypothetical protein
VRRCDPSGATQTQEMTSAGSPRDHRPSLARRGGTVLALALFAAVMWAAWLGWDTDYYEVDGIAHGPYREWQVIGCGLAVVVGAVAAQVWLRGSTVVVPLAVAATVGFAVPWTVNAAATDDSGLFAVGLVMLLVGGSIGLTVVLTLTGAATRRLHDPGVTSGSDRG